VQPAEQATSFSTLGRQCDSGFEKKNYSRNVNFTENCEDPASWLKSLSTAQRDFQITKGPHKFFNYEFPKDVAGRKLSTCYLQRKIFSGEVTQRNWPV